MHAPSVLIGKKFLKNSQGDVNNSAAPLRHFSVENESVIGTTCLGVRLLIPKRSTTQ